MRWSFAHGNRFSQVFAGDPTIDCEGNIYFAFDTLYSVDWEGSLRWKKALAFVGPQPICDVPLVCDATGRVFAIVESMAGGNYVAAIFSPDGSMLGQQTLNTAGYWIDSSPAVHWNQMMAVAGYKNDRLYFVK
jgi:hypothetical protein